MALIQCKECQSQVSNTAKVCPSCGAPVPKPSNKLALFITGFFALVVFLSASNYKSRVEKPQTASIATVSATPAPPPLDCIKNEKEIIEKTKGMMAYYPDGALEILKPCFTQTANQAYKTQITNVEKLIKQNAIRDKKSGEERAKEAAKIKKSRGVAVGMSMDDVRASSWGKPQSINTTTTATTERQQWVYGNRSYLYFQNGTLTSIQN